MATTSTVFVLKELLTYSPAIALIWLIGLVIYRRFFHPLASVPGPFLAAITDLYVLNFNLFTRRSQFYLQVDRLHEKYGPIVRIKPNEVHLSDPDNYDKIYHLGTSFSKEANFYAAFSTSTSGFGTPSNELHRIRRAALSPFFSRKRVLELEHVVQSKAETLRSRVEEALAARQPADLFHGYRALSIDVISDYAFDSCWDLLKRADLGESFFTAVTGLGSLRWVFGFFPYLEPSTRMVPLWLAKALSGSMTQLIEVQHMIKGQITQIKDSLATGAEQKSSQRTIFHQLLDPNSMQGRKVPSTDDIAGEALVLVLAASDTAGNALSVSTYHVLSNERIRLRLTEELRQAFPDPDTTMDFLTLEKLPYLTAVIKEGLRLSYGAPGRLPRVTPKSGAVFNGYAIPGGAVVGMSSWSMHRNPQAFPDPTAFDPDRWLRPEALRAREQCFVPFSRGPRTCLGMQLAYCELYVVLATIFRRIEKLKIYRTGPEDLVFDDYFVPCFARDSNKVAVVAAE